MAVKRLFLCITMFFVHANIQAVEVFQGIKNYNLKEVRLWVKSNPDINIRNNEGQTILHAAVLSGKNRMVKAILKSGINVNILDQYGKTALDYAVEYGYLNIIFRLTGHNAKVTALDNAMYIKNMFQTKSLMSCILGTTTLITFLILSIATRDILYICFCYFFPTINFISALEFRFNSKKNWLLNGITQP